MALMARASGEDLTDKQRAALATLVGDLQTIFATRLHSLVAYGPAVVDQEAGALQTLALVERVTFEDLARAAPLAAGWRRRGLGVPLLLSSHEFTRSLDVFPLEYGSIIAHHVVIVGDHPFADARVADADRRRACEEQAKSHLIHLREGFLETDGDARHVARLIAASVPAFRTLLTNLARLEGGAWPELDDRALAATVERTIGISAPLIADVLSASVGMRSIQRPSWRATSMRASASGATSTGGAREARARRVRLLPRACQRRGYGRRAAGAARAHGYGQRLRARRRRGQ
jgi:hypothetical protein